MQSIQVQVIWRPVASKKHNHPVLYKGLKQTLQYHCVSDIKYLKLIDKEKGQILGELIADYRYSFPGSSLEFFVDVMFHFVHKQHKLRVVQFFLSSTHIKCLIKQIDQERLAAARVSPQVHMLKTIQILESILDSDFLLLIRVYDFLAVAIIHKSIVFCSSHALAYLNFLRILAQVNYLVVLVLEFN